MRGSLMLGRASSSRCSWWRCPPTRSFSSHVVSGVPGRIAPIDSPSIQGGVCGDPNQYPVLNCPNAQDQVFITRFRVFTNGWHQSAAWSYGSCGNLAGAGAASCQFGSPSSSIIGICRSYPGVYTGCDPAFYDIPAGYHWTVAIRIAWTSRHTGGVIGRADYYPTPNASDIDCAYYAEYTVHRCVGPRASIPYNLFAPRNVGYLTLL